MKEYFLESFQFSATEKAKSSALPNATKGEVHFIAQDWHAAPSPS
jgi:hypothetical protein